MDTFPAIVPYSFFPLFVAIPINAYYSRIEGQIWAGIGVGPDQWLKITCILTSSKALRYSDSIPVHHKQLL
jgi:hypothetical protein